MSEPGPSSVRQRLSKQAVAFLTHYATVINAYPQGSEKDSILNTIRAIPGNDFYTIEKLNSWFARHRHPTRRQSSSARASVLVDEETILFPKLSPMHLQQLRMLYRKRTDPAENIITFWAERIKADRHEVVAWIQYQQEKAKGNDYRQVTPDSPDIPLQQLVGDQDSNRCPSPTRPRTHLPTPAKSQSPSESPHERMFSLPPIVVKLEEPRQCLSPLATPISGSFSHSAPFYSSQSFAATVRDSLRHNTTPTDPPPKTPDEFAVSFEKMIGPFMEKHTSGHLARLGWDPSQSHPTLDRVPSDLLRCLQRRIVMGVV